MGLRLNEKITVLKRMDEIETEWWWSSNCQDKQSSGYVPRNYLGLYPRVKPQFKIKNDAEEKQLSSSEFSSGKSEE
ncbi:Putative LOC100877563 [Caligus rogercresseyi]|uniref:LOC100877563 n=1 Tax=Caligus rogercresseyi TaxID=217165 RepID=A0A7T8KLC5_CALRO|nr:Putative LOC100877563 [Caligus rogercresseyi]